MVNSRQIRVDQQDVERMMGECKNMFLKSNPKFSGMNITQKFMFKKLVNWYAKA